MDAKEERIRKATLLYYSKPEIQKAIYDFSLNREVCPRYFEGFGKRPDSFQYPSDIIELVKKGATSFHCSEEIWNDPMKISTSMNPQKFNELRIGWDLLIDIDCKYFEFSKKAAIAVITVLKSSGIKNIGIKYSGSKGFHIIVPWKAFPEVLAGEKTKNLFPELPRKIISYIRFKAGEELPNLLSEEDHLQLGKSKIRKGRKCNVCREIANESYIFSMACERCKRKEEQKKSLNEALPVKCPECIGKLNPIGEPKIIYECRKCNKNSMKFPENFSKYDEEDLFELMGLDLILVSPRHLFRMPYSLHEKTALASIVISEDELKDFQPKNANLSSIKIKNFIPNSRINEAENLIRASLDWHQENFKPKEVKEKKEDFKPIKLEKLSDSYLPPSIQKILQGSGDGRKRALFILINLFRSIGMEKEEMEKRISEWNKKNSVPLRDGYIKAQLIWSFKNKIVLPPNFDKEYYRAIGIIQTEEEMRLKNPVNYILKKANVKEKIGNKIKN